MKAGKLIIAGCLALILGVSAAATTSARPGAASSTRVTIQPWPHGAFGYVKSPAARRCGAHRRVAVYVKRGHGRRPSRDKRVGTVRARRNHGLYQWSTRTNKAGRYYAKAARRSGCARAFSKTIRIEPSTGEGDGNDHYPVCSPYVSEGTSSICDLKTVRFSVNNDHTCDSFGDTSTHARCYGLTDEGPYPWGVTPSGGTPTAGFYWNWSDDSILYVAYKPGQSEGYAHLGGTMPGPNSPEFTIIDGYAQNDQGYPNGDHFRTPNLPGQAAGDVGGPLHIDVSYSGGIYHVTIKGYLYLKRPGSR